MRRTLLALFAFMTPKVVARDRWFQPPAAR